MKGHQIWSHFSKQQLLLQLDGTQCKVSRYTGGCTGGYTDGCTGGCTGYTRKHWWMHSEIDSNLSLHQKSTALNFLLYLLCKRLPANYEKIRNSLTAQDHLIWFILVVRHKECLKLKVVINQTIWSYTSNSFNERTKEIWFCGFSLKTYCERGKLPRWRKIHHVFTQEQILS